MKHLARHPATILGPLAALFVFGLARCAKNPAEDENFIVPPGKADDYFSMTAQEYVVEGTSTVTLESHYANETEDIRMARVNWPPTCGEWITSC